MIHYIMAALLAGAAAQPPGGEELDQAPAAAPAAPDALVQAQAAAARGDQAEALSRYLRVLSTRPDDVAALAGAGQAALAVGDVNAATGFFARAEGRDPRNGAVKAGLGAAMLRGGDARGALRFFRDATDLGVPAATIAADRGLAYDLRGDPRRAQADYLLALRTAPSDEVTRRLAVSQAIGGDRAAALATLDPLLRRQDVAAWRTRAFVRALTGDVAGANEDAAQVLPAAQAQALAPYFGRLASLKPAEKAAAVDLGRFPTQVAAAGPPPRLALDRTVTTVASAAAPGSTAALNERAAAQARAQASPFQTRPAASPPAAAPVQLAQASAPNRSTAALSPALPSRGQAVAPPRPAATAPARLADASPFQTRPTASAPPPLTEPSPFRTQPTASTLKLAQAEAPAPPEPAAPTAAERRAEQARQRAEKLAEQKEAAARKAKADALAQAKAEKAEALAEAKAAKANPARTWVQVAGGANKKDLGRAWDDLRKKWPKQLAGRSPWTLHYRFTNRLLIGPFASSDAAQDWVSERKKEGFATFRVETNAGDEVERVTG